MMALAGSISSTAGARSIVMGTLIVVVGGTRSGKSEFAMRRAGELEGSRCFVATCPITDKEMSERIDKHRRERDNGIWSTIEEPLEIERIIRQDVYDIYLIDCLTLWVSNQMMHCDSSGTLCDEGYIEFEMRTLLEVISTIKATVIFVTGEVGLGIVPENRLARRYRDLVGICNRLAAQAAREVVLVSCGLPIHLKKLSNSIKG
jgi:adenosylcobinamide kinase/adenosylcobinamide-phosphate guanylyltransferase